MATAMATGALTALTPSQTDGPAVVQLSLPVQGRSRLIVLAVALIPLAWLSAVHSLDHSLQSRSPQTLVRITPGTPNGLAVRAQLELAKGDEANRELARALLRTSLARRPLDPFALRLYALTFGGMEALAQGKIPDITEGEKFFRLGERTSRRDVSSQIYLILADAKAGDERAALKRIDRTLRASRSGRDRLFPILGQIMSRPDSPAMFAELVQPNSPWLADFLTFAIDSGVDPGDVARTTAAIGGYPDAAGRPVFEQSLVRALDSRADYRTLAQLLPQLKSLPSGIGQGVSLDAQTMDDEWSPLNWQTSDSPAIRAYPQATANASSALTINMGGGVRGRVARKLVKLAPGTYRLSVTQSFPTGDEDGVRSASAIPEWTVSCLDRDPPSVLLALNAPSGNVAGEFTVGRQCPLIMVALFAKSPESAADAAMTVDKIGLEKVSRPIVQ